MSNPLDKAVSPLSSRMNNDKLFMVPRGRGAQVAHAILEGTRNLPAHEIMAGIAILFSAVAPRFSGGPEELYHIGRKIIDSKDVDHGHDDALVDSLQDWAKLTFRHEAII